MFTDVVTACYTLLQVMLQVATSRIPRIYRACYSVTGPRGVHTPTPHTSYLNRNLSPYLLHLLLPVRESHNRRLLPVSAGRAARKRQ